MKPQDNELNTPVADEDTPRAMDDCGCGSEESESAPVRYSVALLGARMHYAVPRMLQSAGLLDRFFTDMPILNPAVRRLAQIVPSGLYPHSLRALIDRRIDDVPRSAITSFPLFGARYAWRRRRAGDLSEQMRAYLWGGTEFCRCIVRYGLGRAGGVYVFNSAGLELMQHARQRGISCAMEQTSSPKLVETELLRTELERFPGWSHEKREADAVREYADREKAEWAAADVILCGSEHVRCGIETEGGPLEKTVVVPYGVDMQLERGHEGRHAPNDPLRVLFAGAIGLQKGIGDLARAASLLGKTRPHVRAAGSNVLTEIGRKEVEKHVQLLGRIPRSQMVEEYRRADVFVLPSICEGSATVCYEALAAGLPVITTPNSGSVVRDGIDGFIVPIRSPEAIAEKLDRLASNSALWYELSRNARERARDFTVDRYRDRLLESLKNVKRNGLTN